MRRLRQPLDSRLTRKAKELRRHATVPERRLWRALRARQIHGLKFRRQFVIRPYVVDFYCPEANPVVEVDGESHDRQLRRDRSRDRFLRSRGLRVLRVTNDDVMDDLEAVVRAITLMAGKGSYDPPPAPPWKGGEADRDRHDARTKKSPGPKGREHSG